MRKKKHQKRIRQENKSTLLPERRSLEDRRAYSKKQDQRVYHYRSKQPDRRLNNLSAEWLAFENILIPPMLRVRYLESMLPNKTRYKRPVDENT